MMGKHVPQQFLITVPPGKTLDRRLSGMPAQFLIGEADFDGFLARMQCNFLGHHLVRGSRRGFRGFWLHNTEPSQIVTSFSTAWLRLGIRAPCCDEYCDLRDSGLFLRVEKVSPRYGKQFVDRKELGAAKPGAIADETKPA